MEINLEKEALEKNNKLIRDKLSEDYDKFYKKENLKVSLINVDSSFRIKNPKNIYTSSINYLPKDPIKVEANSQIITINYPNHGLEVNDQIIIQNVTGYNYVVSGNIFLFNNFNYAAIKIKHYYTTDYVNLLNKVQVSISVVDKEAIGDKTLYENIPLNSIVGTFNIVLPSIADNIKSIPDNVLNGLNVKKASELNSDYIFIELPFDYYSLDKTSLEITDFLKISFTDINGIPLNGINADYPVNYERLQGFQQVYEVINSNTFTIKSSYLALTDGVSGGNKIQIMKITKTEEGYPDANNYLVKLKKNFNNVVRIELVSTEFPFIDYLVKSNGKNKNNKIYWKQFDDGNYIYSTEIPEGNYDGTSLLSLLQTKMNQVERIKSTQENKLLNNFTIDFNAFTQEVKFSAFKTESIPNSLKVDVVTINSIKYLRLTIRQLNNLVELKDAITIQGATAIGVIPATSLNTTHEVYEVNKSTSTYTVLLGTVTQLSATSDLTATYSGNGGGATTVKTRSRVSLLFNYPDTIGNILGFRNTGSQNAITPYNSIISNFDDYINDTRLNTVGNLVTTNLLLNLTGSNNYFLLYINDFELVNNNSAELPCFAKILMSGLPGDILYNTFINYPLEFDFPVPTLNELKIKITYSDGSLPDFRNIDHSFTLKITELVNFPRNTGVNSKKTNYLQTMKEFALE